MSGLTKRTVVKIAALIIGPALFAQGCLLGPNFKAPPVAVADKWIEEGNKSVDPSAAEHRDWWTAFNDPVLNDLIQLAYQRNSRCKAPEYESWKHARGLESLSASSTRNNSRSAHR